MSNMREKYEQETANNVYLRSELERITGRYAIILAEHDRLRAELAAEKEALTQLVNASDQLVAKSFFYDGFETKQIDALSLNILERAADTARPYAAIRASNAAPPQPEGRCPFCQHGTCKNCTRVAAPPPVEPTERPGECRSPIQGMGCQWPACQCFPAPPVEPSAAESDDAEVNRILSMSDAEIVSEALASGVDIEVTAAHCRAIFERAQASVDARHATEARMVELARAMTDGSYGEWGHAVEALPALVIETFGGGK
jgi:hypothetical protein